MRNLFLILTALLFFFSCDENNRDTGDTGDTGNTGDAGNTGDDGNTGNPLDIDASADNDETDDTGNTGQTDDTLDNDETDEDCIPDCNGFACGDDGCGGSCGVCDKENEGCMDHQCGPCTGNFPNVHDGTCWSDLLEEKNTFDMAKEACSSIGGRLPTVDESRSIIINCPATETGGECGITNYCPDCYEGKEDDWVCNGCHEEGGGSNKGIYSIFDDEGTFWTSTAFEHKGYNAVDMVTYRQNDLSSANTNASVGWMDQNYEHEFPVRCVSK
ncbi:MAG TPA: hypothetical protein P5044_01745 [bacterium]|nr:hypothetical protein [bacterium]